MWLNSFYGEIFGMKTHANIGIISDSTRFSFDFLNDSAVEPQCQTYALMM
jgi:hypothetical protein